MFKKSLFFFTLLFLSVFFTFIATNSFSQVTLSEQTLSLKSGFNFISFTVTPPPTPQALKDKSAAIENIYSYSAAAGSFLSMSEGNLASLSTGKGYIIKAQNDASITINGPPAANIGDITLKKGFNLLGFSKLSSASPVRSFTHLINATPSISGVYKWSPASGSFIQAVRGTDGSPSTPDGIDPTLKAGEAYFINAAADTKINYDNGVTIPKVFDGIYIIPDSAVIAAGGNYDLNKVKLYSRYTDGSTSEVTVSPTFSTDTGSISGTTYTAPKYATSAVITVTYTDTATNSTKTVFFTLAVTGTGSIQTTAYKCSYKLAAKTKIVDEGTVITESLTSTQIVLNTPTAASAPAVGDIVVGYYGDGYIRKAASVSVQGTKVVVTTSRASLEEAFENLNFQYKGKLSALQAADTSAAGSPESRAVARFLRSRTVMPSPAPDRSIISKDNLKKILDNVSLSVTLTRADIDFDPVIECDLQIDWFTLKRFLFVVGGSMACGIEFQVDATAAVPLPIKSELAIFHSKPHIFSVGPVPFTFEWDITCGIDASAAVTGSYKYSNDWNYNLRLGAEYDGTAWKKINEITKTASAKEDYEMKGAIEIKPRLSFGFMLKIAGVTGPKIALEVFLSFLAEMAKIDRADISVSAGVGASVNFVVEVFSWNLAEFKAELFSYTWKIYERSIEFFTWPPLISSGGGTYVTAQTVALSTTSENALIRYTTDGTDPGVNYGTLYTEPFKIEKSMTVKAIAYKTIAKMLVSSSISQANYLIVDENDPTVAKISLFMTPGAPGSLSPRTKGSAGDNWGETYPEYVYGIIGSYFEFTFIPGASSTFSEWRVRDCEKYTCDYYQVYPYTSENGVFRYNVKLEKKYENYYFRYERFNSNNQKMYRFDYNAITPNGGTITIDNKGDNWYYLPGSEITLTATASPGYLLSEIGYIGYPPNTYETNPYKLGNFETGSVKFKTPGVDFNAAAHFSPKRTATVIVEPSADNVAEYKLVPSVENKYFTSYWDLSFTVTPAAGKKLVRIDIDYGNGRSTLVDNFKYFNNLNIKKGDQDFKLYVVTANQ